MSTDIDRITLVILHDDGTREKFALRSWVGIPRKGELFWLGDDPHVVVEVEYAVVEGMLGGKSIEAAGVYVRRLSSEEQTAVAKRLSSPAKGGDDRGFRP
jgi:hypothetical protein